MRKAYLGATAVVVIAILVAFMMVFTPIIQNTGSNAPLVDAEVSMYINAQNDLYSESVVPFDDENVLSDEEIIQSGFSTTPPEGYAYSYVRHTTQGATQDLLTLGVMDGVWYPGALVKLTNDSGTTVPVTFQAFRAPYTLSIGLEGSGITGISAVVENPSPSAAREAVASMVNNALNSGQDIPTSYTCTVIETSSSEALYASLGTTVDLFGFSLGASVDYTDSSDKTVAALVFKQVYYNVTMDPPVMASSVFSDGVSADFIHDNLSGDEALAYVDVTYGKIIIVQIETTKTMDELKTSFDVGYTNAFDIESSFKDMMSNSETRMSYFVYGGSNESLGLMEADSILEVVSAITEDDSYTAKPIMYSFKFLDGMPAHFYTYNDYITREIIRDTTDHFGENFDGGDGSTENPYLISNREQLELVAERLDSNYRLISDIDLGGEAWVPIGDAGDGAYSRFSGTFDGDGHTISNMRIDSIAHVHSGGAHVGLFAIIDNGTVRDLSLTGVDVSPIKGDSGVLKMGSVSGSIIGGTISGVYTEGDMICSEGYEASVNAGGIVGTVDRFGNPHKVVITGCISDVDVHAYGNDAYAGGIAGFVNGSNTEITYCFNYGDVSATGYGGAFDYKRASAGGMVGKINSSCTMEHVFNSGRLDTDVNWGYRDSAGLVGNVDSNSVSITDSYYLRDTNYENGRLQSDVFCDGGSSNVSGDNVVSVYDSDISGALFVGWNLAGHGMYFNGIRVAFM